MSRSFRAQDLTGVDFGGCDLTRAVFEDCELSGVSFRRAELNDACFVGCRAFAPDLGTSAGGGSAEAGPPGIDFRFADLRGARFERCDQTLANFASARAYDACFEHCQLQGADFSGCDFTLPIQSSSHLARFRMHGCNAAFIDLSNTCLDGCELTDNRLIDGQFHNTRLVGTDLGGSDLTGLSGQGLVLDGADLRGARFNTLDPRRMSLTGVKMGFAQALAILQILEIEVDPEAG